MVNANQSMTFVSFTIWYSMFHLMLNNNQTRTKHKAVSRSSNVFPPSMSENLYQGLFQDFPQEGQTPTSRVGEYKYPTLNTIIFWGGGPGTYRGVGGNSTPSPNTVCN